ncbi:hypothetical protein EPUS_01190 [Endocarpon pusillum Z07020]|uniref:Uncharacterized protein n=1 Tax=Endocarpon pusillum (strain Z07020 / HMAS-L-300199) TaxID=1263415 RepID=U1GB42_ENDPU|nr:uncharacterized protein EPUS_01190 [Endocarpon pusillum Z07020]ERF69233.1 hypothetical protein EPUS_01190 [Endocarpon pusillum Z07020]
MDYRPPTRQARAILEKAPAQETEYMGMLLHMSQVIEKRPYWNILAAACTWILLAGFIVLPGTYTNFQNSDIIEAAKKDQSNVGNKILASIANIGLLIVAAILCGVGVLGVTGLWLKWRANYIWLINKVLLPALLNSVMGLLSTLVNVLSKPDKTFSLTAKVTTGVTGGLTLIWTFMFLYYNNYLLDAVKADHRRAYGDQDAKDAIANSNGQPVVRLIDVAEVNAPHTTEEMFHSLDLVTLVDAPNFEIRLVLMSRNALSSVRSEDCILILMSESALLLAPLQPKGNRFSVLETFDAGMPTQPATPPQCPFTFSLPLPDSSPEASIAVKDSPCQRPSRQVETTCRPVQRMPNNTGFDLNSPSIPMTPASAPEVRLPDIHPCESEDAHTQPEPPSLNDFTIPSPLLYHSKSREDLLGDSKEIDSSKNGKIVIPGHKRSDPKFESFKLGSPLQRPCDDRQSRSLLNTRLNRLDNMDFHSINDAKFYQDTRTYLTSPYERKTKCTVEATSEDEPPILTPTNMLSQRPTHIYPGEFAVNPPIRLPSSNRNTDSPATGVAEQPSPAPASAVNLDDSWGCKGQIYLNAGLATPPPEKRDEQSPAPLSETIKNECKERRKRRRRRRAAKRTNCAHARAQETSSEGNNTSVSPLEPIRSPLDEKITQTFPSNNSYPTRPDTSKASATPSRLPRAVTSPSTCESRSPAASSPPPLSSIAYSPSPPGKAYGDQTPDMVKLQACPTTTCTALVIIIPPTTEELVSESHQDRCRWLLGRRGPVEVAAARFAEELGLETEHAQGCAFDGKRRIRDDKHEDEDMGGETGTETVVDQRNGAGSSPAVEEAKEDHEDGVMVVGSASASADGWEDEWVGAGKSKDFWI